MDREAIIDVIKRRYQLHRDYALGMRSRPPGEEVHGDKSWAITQEYEELLNEITRDSLGKATASSGGES